MVGGEFPVRVTCEWGVHGVESAPADAVIVVIDVLCFTTCVSIACGRGATVFPCVWNDDRASKLGEAEGAIIAAKRGQPGYTLSPASYGAMPAGVRLVLPSPNGSTLSFAARERGVRVVAGSLRNAAAVARWCDAQRRPVAIVPAGERWADGGIRFALEDWLGAGAIASRMAGDRSGEAEAAVAAFERLRGDLRGALARCPSGRELIGRGYPEDIELAAALDVDDGVPVLEGNAFTLSRS